MVLPEQNDGAVLKTKLVRLLSNPVFLGLFLAAVTLIVFWPVTRCEFINYDDPDYFTSNPHVLSGLKADNVAWAFTTGRAGNWHPLTWLSLMLDAELSGKNPAGPHLTNLLFHTLNMVLLFLLLKKMTAANFRSAFVAALFALHPLHVESVAWISERKDVLSTFFALLAFLSYERYAKENRRRSFWFSLVFFAFSLMAKPMLVTMPFVLLLLDWWPLGRLSWSGDKPGLKRLFVEKIPFFVLSVISSVITFFVQQKGGAVATLTGFSLSERIENAFVAYAQYLYKTIWPVRLANPYPHPGYWDLSLVIFSILLVFCLSALAALSARRFPYVFTGWFWFVGTLVPVIGLVQVGIQSMADRYTYFPLIGVFIVFTWGATEFCVKWRMPKTGIAILMIIVLAACSLQTRTQLGYWKNNETLFRHTLAVTKNNYTAYNNLGTWLSKNGRLAEAMDCFNKSLQINPDDYEVLYNLGNAFSKLGGWDEAINYYQRSLQIRPDQSDILNNLGFALAAKKQYVDATACFEAALKINPDFAGAHNNFATVLFIQHKFEAAAQHYREAIRLTPDDPQLYANLGDALVKLGQIDQAAQNYQTALQLNPTDARTRTKLQALGVQISN